MAHGCEVDQDNAALGLLQRQRRIDGGSGGASATFGPEKCKDTRLACPAASARPRGTETGESLEQRRRTRRVIQILARAGTHAGHDRRRVKHLSIRENGDLQSRVANQLNRSDRPLRFVRCDINQHDFGPQVLNLTQDGVGWAGWKTDVTEDNAGQRNLVQTLLQRGQMLPVLRQEGYSNPMHSAVLTDFSGRLHVMKRMSFPPSDLSNRGQRRSLAKCPNARNTRRASWNPPNARRTAQETARQIRLSGFHCMLRPRS